MSDRTRPAWQLWHDRGIRLAAGLAVVVAIPMAVLFYFQFRSLNDIEKTSTTVLRRLSSDTADSLVEPSTRGRLAPTPGTPVLVATRLW